MIKTFNDIEILYTESDLEYIEDVYNYFKDKYQEIMDFFSLEKLDKKLTIKFWNNKEEFRSFLFDLTGYEEPDWVVGKSISTREMFRVDILSLEERRKCSGHNNDSITHIKKVIVHEFVHTCHTIYKDYKISPMWFNEFLATYLAKQYDPDKLVLDFSLDDIMNGKAYYNNYFSMGVYLIKTKGVDYVLDLAKNPYKIDTKTIYEETLDYIKKNK